MKGKFTVLSAVAFGWFLSGSALAQFIDNFDGPAVAKDWTYFSGDGVAATRLMPSLRSWTGAWASTTSISIISRST